MNENESQNTVGNGKRLFSELEDVLSDAATFIVDLCKTVYIKIKEVVDSCRNDDPTKETRNNETKTSPLTYEAPKDAERSLPRETP